LEAGGGGGGGASRVPARSASHAGFVNDTSAGSPANTGAAPHRKEG
jgi:hypothetical protein